MQKHLKIHLPLSVEAICQWLVVNGIDPAGCLRPEKVVVTFDVILFDFLGSGACEQELHVQVLVTIPHELGVAFARLNPCNQV